MKRVVLIILDGWGIGRRDNSNAIHEAKTPTLDYFQKYYPATALQSAGIAIGLPWNESGNSEVGHLTIGAGRVLYQHLPRISLAIKNKEFFKNPALVGAFEHAKKNNSQVHIIGLLTDGNVHASYEHLRAFIQLAKQQNKQAFFHLFSDGKDSPLKSGKGFTENFLKELEYYKAGKLASMTGRNYSMNRKKNWDMTEKTYNLLTIGEGNFTTDILKTFDDYYEKGTTDPYVLPTLIADKNNPEEWPLIKDNDSIIFFNFREDSMRQISSSFALDNFSDFERKKVLKNISVSTMTQYDDDLSASIAFPPETLENGLSEIIGKSGKKQLKIAETEKFFHLTYFFNGITDEVFDNEFRVLLPSKKLSSADKDPTMRAKEIADRLITAVNEKAYELIVVNFANADIIAHTGNYDATVKAVEEVDGQLARIYEAAQKVGTTIAITSDHGNAEQVFDPHTGEKETEHNANPVPFYLVDDDYKRRVEKNDRELANDFNQTRGILGDVAPTILNIMDVPIPKEMTGKNLIPYIT